MSIDEKGFLDDDAASWIVKHREDLKELFEVCQQINRLAQTNLYRLQIHNENLQEMLVALLLVRALSSHQTSILLIERGLAHEARIILRHQLEILFKLRALSLDRQVAQVYVQEDEVFRRKFMNKFKLLSAEVQRAHGDPQINELLAQVNQNIEAKGIAERQTQWYAQRAGLTDFYNSAYSLFSSTVHANARDLESLVRTDENGKVVEILYGPDVATALDMLLLTGGEAQCLILQDVSRTFSLKIDEQVQGLHDRLKALMLARGHGRPSAPAGAAGPR